jgi:ribosome-associated translation inhibitor RaiA
MTINIQSVHFDADKRLLDFITEKTEKLNQFYDGLISCEVTLRLDKSSTSDNKISEIKLLGRGHEFFAKKHGAVIVPLFHGTVAALPSATVFLCCGDGLTLNRMRHVILLAIFLVGAGARAQQVRRDALPAVTIRGNIGIQKPLTSAQFRQSFAGLYEGNVSANVRIAGNLSAGAGYQSTYFKTNEFLRREITARASLPYRTSLISDAGFIRLGYDHFFKTNGFIGYALSKR